MDAQFCNECIFGASNPCRKYPCCSVRSFPVELFFIICRIWQAVVYRHTWVETKWWILGIFVNKLSNSMHLCHENYLHCCRNLWIYFSIFLLSNFKIILLFILLIFGNIRFLSSTLVRITMVIVRSNLTPHKI